MVRSWLQMLQPRFPETSSHGRALKMWPLVHFHCRSRFDPALISEGVRWSDHPSAHMPAISGWVVTRQFTPGRTVRLEQIGHR